VSIASGSMISHADRDAWLAERRNSVGASEAGTVLGLNPWETVLQLYLKKLGLADETVETPAMRWGTRLEPLIAEEYSARSGRGFIAEQLFVRSPEYSFMTATLDRVRDDGRIVELKTVGARGAAEWGEPDSDEIPPRYLAQVLHQLIVTETEVADVAVLIAGQDFRTYTVEKDADVAARIIESIGAFWSRVQRRDPPPPDYARDAGALARLYPRAEGEVEMGPIGEILVRQWEELGQEIHVCQEHRETVKAELLTLMREAASARLADGRILSRRVVEVAERVVKSRAYSYTDLRLRRKR
jgi:putative phage-type endonuclease